MIKYICNICKHDIHVNELATIKTQIGDKVTVAHLCPKCLRGVRRVCKENLTILQMQENTNSENKCSTITNTEVENKPNFKLKLETFLEGLPTSKPHKGGVINVQRILLCMYQGQSLPDIVEGLKLSYQTVFQSRRRYSSREIALRHLESARLNADICNIIDMFIKHGDVNSISIETGKSIEEIKDILLYYTGYTW